MEFNIFIKSNDTYEHKLIVPPSGVGTTYFQSLRIKVNSELEQIKNDIVSLFPDNNCNLKKPKHEDYVTQSKVNKLIKIRKQNLKTKEILTCLLSDNEFIICDICRGKMYKKPVNVSYTRYGKQYLIDERVENVRYSYMCEDCVMATSEDFFNLTLNNIKLREKLIADGYNYVPNKYGFWYKIDDNKPLKKPVYLCDIDDKTWRREFEYIKIDRQPNRDFVKITETCPQTGETRTIN